MVDQLVVEGHLEAYHDGEAAEDAHKVLAVEANAEEGGLEVEVGHTADDALVYHMARHSQVVEAGDIKAVHIPGLVEKMDAPGALLQAMTIEVHLTTVDNEAAEVHRDERVDVVAHPLVDDLMRRRCAAAVEMVAD